MDFRKDFSPSKPVFTGGHELEHNTQQRTFISPKQQTYPEGDEDFAASNRHAHSLSVLDAGRHGYDDLAALHGLALAGALETRLVDQNTVPVTLPTRTAHHKRTRRDRLLKKEQNRKRHLLCLKFVS